MLVLCCCSLSLRGHSTAPAFFHPGISPSSTPQAQILDLANDTPSIKKNTPRGPFPRFLPFSHAHSSPVRRSILRPTPPTEGPTPNLAGDLRRILKNKAYQTIIVLHFQRRQVPSYGPTPLHYSIAPTLSRRRSDDELPKTGARVRACTSIWYLISFEEDQAACPLLFPPPPLFVVKHSASL